MILVALAQQAVEALPAVEGPQTVPTCELVTPRGDAIGFFMWGGDNPEEINFSATAGSAWPTRSLVGESRARLGDGLTFSIGGSDGFILMLGPPEAGIAQRTAMLTLRDGGRAMPPLAYGFCEERPTPSSVAAPASSQNAGSDHPAFDLALWPAGDCGMILSDGRRVRLKFRLNQRGQDQVELQSAALWSGQTVTASIRWRNGEKKVGTFSREGGPEGDQILLTGPSRAAAKLIRVRQLGEASSPNLRGYGICGYSVVERRARP
jgi:hypothetical protein